VSASPAPRGDVGVAAPPAAAAGAPHAPEASWGRRILGPFHATGVFWHRLPYRGFRSGIMTDWFYPIATFVFTTIFYLSLWKIGRAIASNLEAVLGPCSFLERQRRIFRTLHQFAWCYGARYDQLVRPQKFQGVVEGQHHVDALDPREGLMFVTAHIGHWEVASHMPSSGMQRRVHVVREEEMDPDAQALVEQILRDSGTTGLVTHFAGDDLTLGLRLSDALRQGEIVALQADRPRTGGRARTISMFGRPMSMPMGPAVLARATGVPVVPVFSFREGYFRYRVVVRQPFRVEKTADRDADVVRTIERLGAEIEWAIRERPHQWFCFRRLW
jgi:lauroyl/myristoyl acyltransferase